MTADADWILGLETSTETASLALLDSQGRLLAEASYRARRTMAARLVPWLDDLLRSQDAGPERIGSLAVGLGPGSFTSLRVGLATAKGLALAAPRPTIGIGSLEVMAAAAPLNERQPVCAVVMAPKRRAYAALYARHARDAMNCLFGPELLELDELLQRLADTGQTVAVAGVLDAAASGQFAAVGAEVLPALYGVPRAAVCAWLGWRRLQDGPGHDVSTLTPLYVHPSEPEVRFGQVLARHTGPDPAP